MIKDERIFVALSKNDCISIVNSIDLLINQPINKNITDDDLKSLLNLMEFKDFLSHMLSNWERR